MTTVTSILGSDLVSASRTTINTNFNNLNNALQGYTLQLGMSTNTPVDSTTYYGGSYAAFGALTVDGSARVYIPKAGTIKSVYVLFNNFGTVGTAETSTLSLRLNGTTDTTINASFATNTTPQSFNITGQSIAVVAGDSINLKWVAPAWVTNPSNLQIMATVYIE